MTEDQLREQMRWVDELTPPEDGFESKAWYAAQQRLARRRAWTTGLAAGAVAVAAVGAGVLVVTVPRQSASTLGSGAAAPGVEQGAVSEDGPGAAGSTAGPSADERTGDNPGGAPEGPRPTPTPTSRPSPTTLPPSGTSPFDWNTPQAVDAVAAVQATLTAPPFDEVFTALRVDRTVPQPYLLVHLTRFDPAAMKATQAGFPPGTPIAFAQSAYSAKACAATLARVQGDEPQLRTEGYGVARLSCDETGRVDVRLDAASSTQERVDALQRRYGDVVTVLPGP